MLLDLSLTECGLEHRDESWVQEESVKGRGFVVRETSAPRERRVGQVGGGPALMPSCSVTFINDDGEKESAGS